MFLNLTINKHQINKPINKNSGYNIGIRLIEDFLARSNVGRCQDFKETGEIIAKVKKKNIHFTQQT